MLNGELLRLNSGKHFAYKWITNTMPGTHKKDLSIPLVVAVRDNLKLVSTKRELNYLINNKLILLNNKAVNNSKIAAGLFDVVAFPNVKKYYRVVLDKNGKFMLIEISDKESNLILLKVTRKVAAKGKKIILTLSNGYNINFDKKVSVNDTVVFDTSSGKIKNVLSYKKKSWDYDAPQARAPESFGKALPGSAAVRHTAAAPPEADSLRDSKKYFFIGDGISYHAF